MKEGEAQYAVVHCTGYIKAWPPAGKQDLPLSSRPLGALASPFCGLSPEHSGKSGGV